MLFVARVLNKIRLEHNFPDAESMADQIRSALTAYALDPTRSDGINNAVVKHTGLALKRFENFKTVENFSEIEDRTLQDALRGSRAPHDETITKVLIWLCSAEFAETAGATDCGNQMRLLVRAADAEHAKGASFPQNLRMLSRLMRRLIAKPAKTKRLHILVDCADLGSFFEPKLHQEIFDHIVHLANLEPQLDVRMLVYGRIQAVTSAAKVWPMATDARLRDTGFRESLDAYVAYLRVDDKKLRRPVSFEHWLRDHSDNDLGEFHAWIAEYGPMKYRRSLTEGVLQEWLKCAIRRVYVDGRFTDSAEDANALLALQWGRERYFEELLVCHSVDVRRKGSSPPPIVMWISESAGAFGFLETDHEDESTRGWILDTSIVTDKQKREPCRPRYQILQIFESVFNGYWDGAKKVHNDHAWASRNSLSRS